MYRTKITKEELSKFQVVAFEGQVIVIDTREKVKPAVDFLLQHSVVGIDTETKPSFVKGVHYSVALLQISTLTHCFLFRLNKIGLTDEIAAFLAHKQIKKIGLSLRDDLNGLMRRHKFNPENFIDIQNLVHRYGILELGLQKIYAIVFGQKISKTQQLTNWENDVLTEQQQRYAATDAWATLMIYNKLIESDKLSDAQVLQLLADNAPQVKNN